MTRKSKQVVLRFDAKLNRKMHEKDVRDGLSVAVRTGKTLWLSSDEGSCLERLIETRPGVYERHTAYNLTEFIDLPDSKRAEIDIEGMAVGGGYLWISGSHSLKRKKPTKNAVTQLDQLKRLATVELEPNRFLLARIPLAQDGAAGEYSLKKEFEGRTAAVLRATSKSNELADALRKDEHLGAFLSVPGKDNGLDIEGLAVAGDKVLLGLRGPVLRGWAAIIRIGLKEARRGKLRLKPLDDGKFYSKHFVYCDGLGIREIVVQGHDLLLLAGPTMVLDGEIAIYRWKQGTRLTRDSIAPKNALKKLLSVPRGTGRNAGRDRAEGLALMSEKPAEASVLVVYDNPVPERKKGNGEFIADIFKIGSRAA